jgi:5-methylcytosine-specific restriction endonuclease McrA|tara:strand:+ start:8053 stop:8403 length:351 start_codon:yes stop_codon:yes gene_type:complete
MPTKPKGKNKTWIAIDPKNIGENGKRKSFITKREHTTFYNTNKWKRLRNYYITKEPLCEVCKRFNKIIEAKVVDHIKRVRTNPELALAENNLQSLCHRCHNIKSGYEGHDKKKNKC